MSGAGSAPHAAVDPARAVLDRRTFAPLTNEDGEVGAGTRFHYRQEDDMVWADYAGGTIRRGYLVGTRHGATLDFRYVQVNDSAEVNSGRCTSTIEVLPDGRLRLHEVWQWESKAGSGSSVVEEVVE